MYVEATALHRRQKLKVILAVMRLAPLLCNVWLCNVCTSLKKKKKKKKRKERKGLYANFGLYEPDVELYIHSFPYCNMHDIRKDMDYTQIIFHAFYTSKTVMKLPKWMRTWREIWIEFSYPFYKQRKGLVIHA